jgi:hypothetical protein
MLTGERCIRYPAWKVCNRTFQQEAGSDVVDLTGAIAAISALGTAAYGLVDAAKAFWGGPSNFGFKFIRECLAPFDGALAIANAGGAQGHVAFLNTLKANWLNGVPMADQKATAKSLIHLGLTPAGAPALAQATSLNANALTALATKVQNGEALLPSDVTLFGRFDAIVSAKLDTGFERADQRYRNAAKALAFGVSVVLGLLGAPIVGASLWVGALVGIVATPLAPVAKDLASSLSAATKAISAVKR